MGSASGKPAKREPQGSRDSKRKQYLPRPERGGGQVLFRLALGRASLSGSASSLLFFSGPAMKHIMGVIGCVLLYMFLAQHISTVLWVVGCILLLTFATIGIVLLILAYLPYERPIKATESEFKPTESQSVPSGPLVVESEREIPTVADAKQTESQSAEHEMMVGSKGETPTESELKPAKSQSATSGPIVQLERETLRVADGMPTESQSAEHELILEPKSETPTVAEPKPTESRLATSRPQGVAERTSHIDPFIAAILESPDDDSIRLIYADWLDERGDPRGEFIRVQCELARLIGNTGHRQGLESRERELLKSFRKEWDKSVDGVCRCGTRYRRGFIEEIEIRAEVFAANTDRLFGLAPINSVILRGGCGTDLNDAVTKAIADNSQLSKLNYFGIDDYIIRDSGAEAIASSTHLSNLITLTFSYTGIGSWGAEALAKSHILIKLATLELHANQIGDAGARALAASTCLLGLTCLNVGQNGIGPNGAVALAGSRSLANLLALDLRGNHVGVRGAEAIASSPNLSHLMTLNLDGNEIGNAGALALARSTQFTQLRRLHLAKNGIRATGKEALRIRFENGVSFG